jgi:hypothetical protein
LTGHGEVGGCGCVEWQYQRVAHPAGVLLTAMLGFDSPA